MSAYQTVSLPREPKNFWSLLVCFDTWCVCPFLVLFQWHFLAAATVAVPLVHAVSRAQCPSFLTFAEEAWQWQWMDTKQFQMELSRHILYSIQYLLVVVLPQVSLDLWFVNDVWCSILTLTCSKCFETTTYISRRFRCWSDIEVFWGLHRRFLCEWAG